MQHISFPSIEQFRNVIKTVRERSNWHAFPVPTISFIGTVKLHGTNAAVCSHVDQHEDFWAQSRSNVITPENDNCGFAAWTQTRKSELIKLLDCAQIVFNDRKNSYANDIISVYGEWCGQGIQKGVAISQLPKMFVIFAISVYDSKEPDRRFWFSHAQVTKTIAKFREAMGNVDVPEIRCIYDYETWRVDVNFNNPELVQNNLGKLTERVEHACPVGLAHGVTGIGEGIVWAAQEQLGVPFPTSDLIFKVKGEKHSVSKVKTLAAVDVERVASINEFVESVVTEVRLQQGIAVMKEQGLEDSIENTGAFLKWIGQDVLKEESDTLEANGLERKEVMPQISRVARQWYIQYQQGKPL